MSEIKAVFAERTKHSLKGLYRYEKVCGYKYFWEPSENLTTLKSRLNCSIDFGEKNVTNSAFLFPFCTINNYPNEKNSCLNLKTEVVSSSMIHFSAKFVRRKFYKKKFGNCCMCFQLVLNYYTKKNEQEEIISGEYFQQRSIKVF